MATLAMESQRPPPAVKEGEAALAWLEEPTVRDRLGALCRDCPWATCFQGWAFITTWYRCYQATSEPVLLYCEDGERLTGFFALARDRQTGRLAVAGDHQAEYQGWLALPDDGDSFLQAALSTIGERYRPDQLRLRYLPAKAPMGWIETPLASGALVERRLHQRPLFSLADPKAIKDSLRKKANKSRLNRLKRQGEVTLRHLETRPALEAVIDEIIEGYDLRQGAANGVCPFTDDAQKRRFHLDLMAHPGLMQASVLTVGDRIAAAHLGLHDGDSVAVGVFGHAPAFGKHSPGKFLMLMLGAELAELGKAWLDLTPGGAWKDRFATDHDQVLEVTVFFTRSLARKRQATETVLAAARSSLALVGATPDDARRFARNFSLGPLFGQNRAAGAPALYYRPCSGAAGSPGDDAETSDIARNRTRDLLRFDPKDGTQSRKAFLAAAEAHLANGDHLYSRIDDGRLTQAVWRGGAPGGDNAPSGDAPGGFAALPGKTVWLDCQATAADRQGLDERSLQAILDDVAGEAERLAVTVAADDAGTCRHLEALGFRLWTSDHARP